MPPGPDDKASRAASRQAEKMASLRKAETEADVSVTFNVYDHDPLAETFYSAFDSNDSAVKGLFRLIGDDLSVASKPYTEHPTYPLYRLTVNIRPKPPVQSLTMRFGDQK